MTGAAVGLAAGLAALLVALGLLVLCLIRRRRSEFIGGEEEEQCGLQQRQLASVTVVPTDETCSFGNFDPFDVEASVETIAMSEALSEEIPLDPNSRVQGRMDVFPYWGDRGVYVEVRLIRPTFLDPTLRLDMQAGEAPPEKKGMLEIHSGEEASGSGTNRMKLSLETSLRVSPGPVTKGKLFYGGVFALAVLPPKMIMSPMVCFHRAGDANASPSRTIVQLPKAASESGQKLPDGYFLLSDVFRVEAIALNHVPVASAPKFVALVDDSGDGQKRPEGLGSPIAVSASQPEVSVTPPPKAARSLVAPITQTSTLERVKAPPSMLSRSTLQAPPSKFSVPPPAPNQARSQTKGRLVETFESEVPTQPHVVRVSSKVGKLRAVTIPVGEQPIGEADYSVRFQKPIPEFRVVKAQGKVAAGASSLPCQIVFAPKISGEFSVVVLVDIRGVERVFHLVATSS